MKMKRWMLAWAICASCCACTPAGDGGDDGTAGGDADSDSDSDSDADGDSDIDDQDGDGFTIEQGDCDDYEPFVNPWAIEDLGEDGEGDGVDNDCDGETDEHEPECDCTDLGATEQDLARALHFCDERFILSVSKDMTSTDGEVAFDTLYDQGTNDCIHAQHGCEMAALSTGPIGQANPNNATGMGGMAEESIDPLPEYQGDQPTSSTVQSCCDRSQLRLALRAPTNAQGFSFDFLFASAEYDEWINMGFNDTFYAIMEHPGLNGGATTNIAFDDNDNEIEVDTNFFENELYPCDESGSGWEPSIAGVSGSTGWLRTSWPVEPGSEFALTFSIHDEGDCIYDSIVFIDGFTWHTNEVDPGTDPIVE